MDILQSLRTVYIHWIGETRQLRQTVYPTPRLFIFLPKIITLPQQNQ